MALPVAVSVEAVDNPARELEFWRWLIEQSAAAKLARPGLRESREGATDKAAA